MSRIVQGTDGGNGFSVPAIESVMQVLNQYRPALRFPFDNAARIPEACDWVRGGTFPGGNSAGGPGGNWFIGHQYLDTSKSAPQRIVWVPPEPGRENFIIPDSTGWRQDRAVGSPPLAYKTWRSRLVPFQVQVWGNSYEDTEELVHWLCSSVYAARANSPQGEDQLGSGGFIPLQDGQRGIVYVLEVRFAFPIISLSPLHPAKSSNPTTGARINTAFDPPVTT